jgi:hypothetical protein
MKHQLFKSGSEHSLLNLQKAKIIINKMDVHCKADLFTASVTHVNIKSGFYVNMSIDINQELDNIAVNISEKV